MAILAATDADVKKWKELASRATGGVWRVETWREHFHSIISYFGDNQIIITGGNNDNRIDDYELMAASRYIIPALIARIEESKTSKADKFVNVIVSALPRIRSLCFNLGLPYKIAYDVAGIIQDIYEEMSK
jgi:hypothetical protein